MAVKIKKGSDMMQIPVIPLVDTVFNLLIFFLVATKVAEAERELPITPPNASEAQALTVRPKELVVNIDQGGNLFLAAQPVTLHELDQALNTAFVNNHGRTPVTIRADERAKWKTVVAVLNSCKKNKVREYHVTTREPVPGKP
jgi:biopolymer transport protein ExbD